MIYLLDSDWIVDYLKGKAAAVQLLQSFANDSLTISTITYGEVFEGIYYGQNKAQIERIFRQFLRGISVLSVTRQIAYHFAIIRGDLRQRGEIIGDPDILIAATALHHNLTLVTQNTRHFQRIPGLLLS